MALLSLLVALALVEVLQPAFSRFLQHPVGLNYARDWPLLLDHSGRDHRRRPGQRQLSGFGAVGFPPAPGAARQQLRTGRIGAPAHRPGGAAIRRLHRAGHRGSVVFTQINYARNIDLGFRKDNVLVVNPVGLLTLAGQESFTQRLRVQSRHSGCRHDRRAAFRHRQMVEDRAAGRSSRVRRSERARHRHQCGPASGHETGGGAAVVGQARPGSGGRFGQGARRHCTTS